MQVPNERVKNPRLYSMPNDDKLWAAFSSYVYLTARQVQTVVGCKPDYTQVRLRRLYEAGFLDRQQKNDFSEFVYFLTERGGELAADRGHLESPKWISKKSPMTLDHDVEISDFHMRLQQSILTTDIFAIVWHQWRGQLAKQFGDWIPDAHFFFQDTWHVLEIVRSTEWGYKKGESSLVTKLKTYDAEKRRVLVVMPTQLRIQKFFAKVEEELPSSRLWFTDEASYRKDILGKIWWTPKNFRERQYSILKTGGMNYDLAKQLETAGFHSASF